MICQNALRAATFKGWRNCCHRREMLLVTLVAVCCGTFLNREMWIVNRNCLGCVHGTGMVRCFFSLPPPPTFPSFKPFFFSFLRKWKMVKIGEKNVRCVYFFNIEWCFSEVHHFYIYMYWLAKNVHSCFSITSLANPIRQVCFLWSLIVMVYVGSHWTFFLSFTFTGAIFLFKMIVSFSIRLPIRTCGPTISVLTQERKWSYGWKPC